MKTFRNHALVALLSAAALALPGTAQAALIARGGGMVYDDVGKITWLADLNYAKTAGYAGSDSGKMTWGEAKAWAAGLDYGGYDDWRLPTLKPSDTSCDGDRYCTGGELSHLFVTDLGNKKSNLLDMNGDSDEQILNRALFSNFANPMATWAYWSGTAYTANSAYVFFTDGGRQATFYGGDDIDRTWFAMAVRDGNVAAAVPEPGSLALAGLALLAVFGMRRQWF